MDRAPSVPVLQLNESFKMFSLDGIADAFEAAVGTGEVPAVVDLTAPTVLGEVRVLNI